jgi:hypothetical protein
VSKFEYLKPSRLERDISKILDKLDRIEANLPNSRPARYGSANILTPPESEQLDEEAVFVRPVDRPETEDDEIGTNPILLVSSASQAITATDSLKQNNFYVLHQALGVPFDYPDLFSKEMENIDLPFGKHYEGPLPTVSATEAERSTKPSLH